MRLRGTLLLALLSACELRVGASKGVRPIARRRAHRARRAVLWRAAHRRRLRRHHRARGGRLEGPALDGLRTALDQKLEASVLVTAMVLLPPAPPAPKTLQVVYEAQPTLIIGP